MILRGLAHYVASRVVARTLTAPKWDPYPRARAIEGGHPFEDMPGSIRIHAADNPGDRNARRWIKDDSGEEPCWILVTGWGADAPSCLDSDVLACLPTRRQSLVEVAHILGTT